jgi:MYXO-CTERM domain-containing protein
MMHALAYYEISAQVLPTLLIALVLGFRELRVIRSGWATWVAINMVVVLAGTGAAVWALRHGGGTKIVDGLIFASYCFVLPGFAALILRWFVHPNDYHSGRAFLQPPEPSPPPPQSPRGSRLSILLLGAAALVGALVGRRRRS